MERNYKIKILDAKKDSDLLFRIVEHEIEVLSSFDREVAYVYGVSTVPKFERNGYARILLEYVMKNLKEIGIKKIELTVDMDNFTAKKIYENLGFKIVENLDNEYGDNIERYLMRYLVK